jgi:N-acetylmannosamine-6-phosphate 2-epimerase/N-acetylmannosamine kinase
MSVLAGLEGKLIVSCQAVEGDPFRDSGSMARFARAAELAGAGGIRVNGVEDTRAIRQAVKLPLIGIEKATMDDGAILITPTFAAARALVEAGADLIALDCTERGQAYGALERVREIRAGLRVPVLADIATEEEAEAAQAAGADAVLSTMRGYTAETAGVRRFDALFVERLAARLRVPVIAEGRIESPADARAAIAAGAYAVVVGTAITRPGEIARKFCAAVEEEFSARRGGGCAAAIDMGGTNTKFGLVSGEGEMLWAATEPTPAASGARGLLEHLRGAAERILEEARRRGVGVKALGIATAGWVDTNRGVVVYATDTLRGWTGTAVGGALREALRIPVYLENDANAAALAEQRFGGGRGLSDFVVITLGTGVGGGCVVGGKLRRGAHFIGNAIGHVSIDAAGPVCICGQRGCLERYANAAAMLGYAGDAYADTEALVAAANAGEREARRAVAQTAQHLARACAMIIPLLDPEAILLSGGPAQNNALLAAEVEARAKGLVAAWDLRRLRVRCSKLGYHGGVLGAAALALWEGAD